MNINDYEYISSNSLVRFRGMIQDMYDPEYYLEKCEIINAVTMNKYIMNGKYCNSISCKVCRRFDVNQIISVYRLFLG